MFAESLRKVDSIGIDDVEKLEHVEPRKANPLLVGTRLSQNLSEILQKVVERDGFVYEIIEHGEVGYVGGHDGVGVVKGELVVSRELQRKPLDVVVERADHGTDGLVAHGVALPTLRWIGDEIFAATWNLPGGALPWVKKRRNRLLVDILLYLTYRAKGVCGGGRGREHGLHLAVLAIKRTKVIKGQDIIGEEGEGRGFHRQVREDKRMTMQRPGNRQAAWRTNSSKGRRAVFALKCDLLDYSRTIL